MAPDWIKNELRAKAANADHCTYCGVPITELDRDELLGLVTSSYEELDRERKGTVSFLQTMTALRKAGGR